LSLQDRARRYLVEVVAEETDRFGAERPITRLTSRDRTGPHVGCRVPIVVSRAATKRKKPLNQGLALLLMTEIAKHCRT